MQQRLFLSRYGWSPQVNQTTTIECHDTLCDSVIVVGVQDNSGTAIQDDFEEGIFSTNNDSNCSCSSLNGLHASEIENDDDFLRFLCQFKGHFI